jgi:hypothetical protein
VLRLSLLLCGFYGLTIVPIGAQQLSATDAKLHTGEVATVCGQVASVHFAAHSRGEPTFLDLDAAYPNQVFTVLVWGEDRAKFGNIDAKYSNVHLCVHGPITQYRGSPEMVVHDPSSISIRP